MRMFPTALVAAGLLATQAYANPLLTSLVPAHLSLLGVESTRVHVTVENLAPDQGTYFTPVWVAFHDGSLDIFDDGLAASASLESMAEDGDPTLLSNDFTTAGTSDLDGLIGSAPIAPGAVVQRSFLLNPSSTNARYFSYVAMILPSNDAFIGQESPTTTEVFDAGGVFVASDFFVTGSAIRDAGTELNDELPENVLLLDQMTPNTGTTEGGIIGAHAGFSAPGSGGILDHPMFSESVFTAVGYPVAKVRFAAAPAITDDREHTVTLKSQFEVPPVDSKAKGDGTISLTESGTVMTFNIKFKKLKNVTGAHLHLGAEDEEGPVVVDLLDGKTPKKGGYKKLKGEFDVTALTGPLAGMPLDALAAEMEAGNVYVNIHTKKFPAGETRGQVVLVPAP